jgi:hypothetical protein
MRMAILLTAFLIAVAAANGSDLSEKLSQRQAALVGLDARYELRIYNAPQDSDPWNSSSWQDGRDFPHTFRIRRPVTDGARVDFLTDRPRNGYVPVCYWVTPEQITEKHSQEPMPGYALYSYSENFFALGALSGKRVMQLAELQIEGVNHGGYWLADLFDEYTVTQETDPSNGRITATANTASYDRTGQVRLVFEPDGALIECEAVVEVDTGGHAPDTLTHQYKVLRFHNLGGVRIPAEAVLVSSFTAAPWSPLGIEHFTLVDSRIDGELAVSDVEFLPTYQSCFVTTFDKEVGITRTAYDDDGQEIAQADLSCLQDSILVAQQQTPRVDGQIAIAGVVGGILIILTGAYMLKLTRQARNPH